MRRLIVLIVTLGLLVSGLAVANPDPMPPSNSGRVTGEIFKEANDQFLSTTEFSQLASNVVFLQFDMPSNVAADGFQIGGSANLFGLYLAGLLYSMNGGTVGQLGANQTQTVFYDDYYSVDGTTGLITGKTETRRVNVDYDVSSTNEVSLLVGLGVMGVGLDVAQSKANSYGNFNPAGAFPGTPLSTAVGAGNPWPNLGVGTVGTTATTVSTFDDSGNPVAVSTQGYGLGEIKDQALSFTGRFGMPLTVAGLELAVGANVTVALNNDDQFGEYETSSQVIGSGTSLDYTPAQALGDATPAEITDLTNYFFEEANVMDSSTGIAPNLFAEAAIPLKEGFTAHAGLGYTLDLSMYNSKFFDTDGVTELAVKGTANTYSSTTVATAVNGTDPTLTTVTTTDVDMWDSAAMSGSGHTVDLSLGFIVEPSELFRFGVMYEPQVMMSSMDTTYAGKAVRTVIVENGDGASGLDDSVTITTVNRGGYREMTQSLMFTNNVNTAAQFFLMPGRLRVNLGASLSNVMVNSTVSETITDGLITYEVQSAADSSDPADVVVTDYGIFAEVRDSWAPDNDDLQTVTSTGSSTIDYEGGLTFFFDESMFLDLRMIGGGGSIWDTSVWSLEMTILY